MNTRKWGAVVGGALFLGTFGVVQGLGVASAAAAPAGTSAVARISAPADPEDYRAGFKAGIAAGREAAEAECKEALAPLDNLQSLSQQYSAHSGEADAAEDSTYAPSAAQRQRQEDFNEGYDAAYTRAYNNAYKQYCN